jgi:hypothetical protein
MLCMKERVGLCAPKTLNALQSNEPLLSVWRYLAQLSPDMRQMTFRSAAVSVRITETLTVHHV